MSNFNGYKQYHARHSRPHSAHRRLHVLRTCPANLTQGPPHYIPCCFAKCLHRAVKLGELLNVVNIDDVALLLAEGVLTVRVEPCQRAHVEACKNQVRLLYCPTLLIVG